MVFGTGGEGDVDRFFLIGKGDHMSIGQDVPIGGNNQARTNAFGGAVDAIAIGTEERVVAQVIFGDRFLGGDIDHSGLDVGDNLDDRFVGHIDLARRGRDLALRSGQRRRRRLRNLGRSRRGRLGIRRADDTQREQSVKKNTEDHASPHLCGYLAGTQVTSLKAFRFGPPGAEFSSPI